MTVVQRGVQCAQSCQNNSNLYYCPIRCLKKMRQYLPYRERTKEIVLVVLAEPLMYPRLCDRIRVAKHMGFRRVGTVPNDCLLNPGLAKKIL